MKNSSPASIVPAPLHLHRRVAGLLAALALLGLSPPAWAQDSLGDRVRPLERETQLEEIVVTARRLEDDAIRLGPITVSGYVEGSYTRNLGNPDQRQNANRFRLSDPDHDAFAVSAAKLGLSRRVSGLNEFDAGFRFEIAAGRIVKQVYEDQTFSFVDQNISIAQAYAELQLPTWRAPLQVRMGRMHSWFGVESLDLYKNPSFSLSPLALAVPKTVTGLSASLELGAGLRYSQFLVQGWDRVQDQNDAKTLGGQLAFDARGLSLALNYVVGAERPDSDSDLRWAVELAARWQVTASTELRASFLYGQEELNDGTAKFGGASVTVSQGLLEVEGEGFHRLTASLRGSYLRDQGGTRTGVDQALGEVTATLALNFLKDASLRLEYRHDFSSQRDAFDGERNQSTLALALHYAF
ncbi:MAG: outer membrane beta-barrel protein [Planctomycetota bacterium]